MVFKIDQNITECLIQGPWLPGFLIDKPQHLQIRLSGENDLSIVMDVAHVLLRLNSKQSKTMAKSGLFGNRNASIGQNLIIFILYQNPSEAG